MKMGLIAWLLGLDDTAEDYFRKHPTARNYVDSEGRLHVNVNQLFKSPKVQADLKKLREIWNKETNNENNNQ